MIAVSAWAVPAQADHSSGSLGVKGVSERKLRAFEKRVLGPAHAREHARMRRAKRAGRLKTRATWLRAERRRRARAPKRARAAVAGDPSDIGRWGSPFAIPVMAVHAALLPTGKVLWFAYPKNPSPRYGGDGGTSPNTSQAWLWDPATGATKQVNPPLWRDPRDGVMKPANLWCAGQSFLADGRLLVTGGNLEYSNNGFDWKGLNKVYTFNPFNETWTEQPDMRKGRWYPSQVLLPDGRTMIMSGRDETGVKPGNINPDIELFTPSSDLNGRGTVTLLGQRGGAGQPPLSGDYPHLFSMPSGRTLVAGPFKNDSWFVNAPGPSNTFTWSDVPNLPIDHLWGPAVLMPGGPGGSTRVMQVGGYSNDAPTAVTEIFDEANSGLGWRAAPSLKVARAHHNTMLLPDGSMVSVGGGVGTRNGDQWQADPEHRQIELWDPVTASWRLGPEQAEARAYHSTALLLPDGRVISAGDDANGGIDRDTAEIYEPPYLHKGPRPVIGSAPAQASFGSSFDVDTPDTNVTKAVLIAPSATTHNTDMSQRYIELGLAQRSGGVRLTAPASAELAPPGYYMLFLVNSAGVPSVAKFIRLEPGAPPPGGSVEKAAGRSTSASSVQGAAYASGMAVDGSVSTRWGSTATDNQWWQVDLGSVRKVDRVELNWEAAYASRYKIQTSTDGTNFSDAADVTISSAGVKTTSFAARDARYVRVLGVTRSDTRYGISIWEAKVFGPSDTDPPPPPPPPPPSSDLALNKPASASGSQNATYVAARANDGSSTTRWSSGFSDNQWWQVDLGSAQQVAKVELNWEAAYASRYKILTSTDGTNFSEAADVTITSPGLKTTTFAARSARYVRVLGVTRATQYGISFWDARVFGPGTDPPPPPPPPPSSDLALNKPASASGSQNATYVAARANDGSSTTRWSSGFSDNQWWQVDLGSAQQVAKVELNWEAAYASRYKILTSTDGTNFSEAADVTITSPGLKTTTFAARSARYVRVLGVTRATQYGISFWDARVFGPG